MNTHKKVQRGIARRDFVKGATASAAAMLGAGVLGVEAEAAPAVPNKWDLEADVVVVGYGGAGACAAIAAKDAGSSVVVLEKAPAPEGGNSGVSSGNIRNGIRWNDADEPLKKIKWASFGTVTDEELIRGTVMDMLEIGPWLEKQGAHLIWMPTPGSKGKVITRVARVKTADGTMGVGKDVFAFLHGVVTQKGITVKLATPANGLIQNPNTREIIGVKAVGSNGKDLFVKAKKGVILACGGYENNPEMQGWFNNPGIRMWPWGTPYNTGDGIKMCASVGANLWHLPGLEWGPVGFRKATEAAGVSVGISATNGIPPHSFIFVNKYGKRFMNEAKGMAHDFDDKPVLHFSAAKNEYPNLPFFMIFDDAILKAGPLSPRQARAGMWQTYNGVFGKYVWSNDNSAELDKGWIFKGDTLAGLAAKIQGTDPSAESVGMDAAVLVDTVSQFNAGVMAKDPVFGREKIQMAPLTKAPFYAIEMSLALVNTQGGAERNRFCQTLDTDGKPIGRLYNVGELGSINGFVYIVGNLTEALTTGRVAGTHAASLKPWG
jgi:succinate dehydrogenase/fumarate reductase flavoprotein subunit